MLVIGRTWNQTVHLTLPTDPVELAQLAGVTIVVTAVEPRQGGCRLGFEAPMSVAITRPDNGEQRYNDRGCGHRGTHE